MDVFAKLNLKDHADIVVLDAPASFEPALKALDGVRVRRALPKKAPVPFVLAFVMTRADVARLAPAVGTVATGDAIVWFAQPKKSSKRYTSELGRDLASWQSLGTAGFEAVRQIAIDEDWTATRFRRVEFIKSLKRHESGAMTTAGRARTRGRA
jgi:hypothetical protein